MEFVIAGLIILALNLAVLGLSIKLYTEVLKDQSQNRRAARATGASNAKD